jgi:hypothetical protein
MCGEIIVKAFDDNIVAPWARASPEQGHVTRYRLEATRR